MRDAHVRSLTAEKVYLALAERNCTRGIPRLKHGVSRSFFLSLHLEMPADLLCGTSALLLQSLAGSGRTVEI